MQEETNMIRLMVELNLFVHRKWRKLLKMQGNLWLNALKCIKKKSVCKYFSGQIIFGINKKKQFVFLSLLHTDNLNFEPWILEIKFPSVYNLFTDYTFLEAPIWTFIWFCFECTVESDQKSKTSSSKIVHSRFSRFTSSVTRYLLSLYVLLDIARFETWLIHGSDGTSTKQKSIQ